METQRSILILLSLVMIASGCTHQNGNGTESEGPESITVQQISVNPQEIYSGQGVRASLRAVNSGNLPAEVDVGKNGEAILKDYCTDIFNNHEKSFSVSTSVTTDEKKSYRLEPGQRLNVRWLLRQEGDVPLYGKRCNLKFSIPFNYSVEAFRQVQIKRNPEVEGSERLTSKSSSGPMLLSIRTLPGTTGKPSTFVATEEGDQYVELLVELINKKPEDGYRKGLVDVKEQSLRIRASDPLELDEGYTSPAVDESFCGGCGNGEMCIEGGIVGYSCENRELQWEIKSGGYGESRCEAPSSEIRLAQGRSITIRCQIRVPDNLDAPSVLSRISTGLNYTYVKDVGERTVEVQSRGQ